MPPVCAVARGSRTDWLPRDTNRPGPVRCRWPRAGPRQSLALSRAAARRGLGFRECDQLAQRGRRGLREQSDRGWFEQVEPHQVLRLLGGEGQWAGQHLEQEGPKGIDIRLGTGPRRLPKAQNCSALTRSRVISSQRCKLPTCSSVALKPVLKTLAKACTPSALSAD